MWGSSETLDPWLSQRVVRNRKLQADKRRQRDTSFPRVPARRGVVQEEKEKKQNGWKKEQAHETTTGYESPVVPAHNYAPIVASLPRKRKAASLLARVLMRLTAPAACRSCSLVGSSFLLDP